MTRVKTGFVTRRRHKKVIKQAKGFRWGRSKLFKLAKNAIAKSGMNAYRDRRVKKRTFRRLWISRVSAFLRTRGEKYSTFINKMQLKNIVVNRKMMADLAAQHPHAMEEIVKKVA
ncbi:50S ribosomal protein L20 [Candidatus Gracilibacteria bacterium]|nr:50S ribosomal protein L20 [Candidatus Gracilibacteria bacterium]